MEDDGYSENGGAWLFQVQLFLTDAGATACVGNRGAALSPLDLVFQYVALVRAQGVQRRVWDELATMAASDFRRASPHHTTPPRCVRGATRA